MGLLNFIAFSLLKILYNLVSMKYFSNASNCWHKQNFEKCPIIFRITHWFCFFFLVVLALGNVVSFTKTCFYRKPNSVTMWKRFTQTLATIWHKSFWQDICVIGNTNCDPPVQSIITWKRDVPNPMFLFSFLISSSFSLSCTIANLVIAEKL